ncbi:MAG: FAD-binding protein, partial [Calditrichaeota bacterium]
MHTETVQIIQSKLMRFSARALVEEQRRARQLLTGDARLGRKESQATLEELRGLLSDAAEIFLPDAVQENIYANDSGTHLLPGWIKKAFVSIRVNGVVRPGCLEDVRLFVKRASEKGQTYTVRGAGTWPFGGAVPVQDDWVLDLSLLDFMELDKDEDRLIFGAGALFPNIRAYLKKEGYTLRQEITNPNSGTLAGWIATGGLGLGAYKYGPVKNSVDMLLVLRPDGTMEALTPEDEAFDLFFGSEGQTGLILGGALRVRRESFVSKAYAFSFEKTEDAHSYMQRLREAEILPTSVIYFDRAYIAETARIEAAHLNAAAGRAMEAERSASLEEWRENKALVEELESCAHVLVMHFDTAEDYEKALKTRLFGASRRAMRIRQLTFRQLSTELAHHLWDHRFLPVQMKQNGPSMLVSETILPLENFTAYQSLVRPFLSLLMKVELKTEAHLLPDGNMLIQSIVLADMRTVRHKIYFALVPLMTQAAIYFGAVPYGIGIWNYPFLKALRKKHPEKIAALEAARARFKESALLNRGKFLNPSGLRWLYRLFARIAPRVNHWFVATTHKRRQGKKDLLAYPVQKLAWKLSGFMVRHAIPSDLRKKEAPLERLLAACAECDSCERSCPTSDVFGMYGPATPITRRKTAERLVAGETLTGEEAEGFLACTRCDNCVRICPADVPLTQIFDLVEADARFNLALNKTADQKETFVGRFWQIMKESPNYRKHTHAVQTDKRSHLEHGLKIIYPRGYEYGSLFIDPESCIHCGMC